MKKEVKYVVLKDKQLVIAIRGDKKAFAKPHGPDSFNEELGKVIATKKLRSKELSSEIKKSKKNIKKILKQIEDCNAQLAKEYRKSGRLKDLYSKILSDLYDLTAF